MLRYLTLTVFTLLAMEVWPQTATEEYTYGFETPLTKPPWGIEGGVNEVMLIEDPTTNIGNKVLRARLPIPPAGAVWNSATTRSEIRWQKGAKGIPNWFPNGSSYSFQFRIFVPENHTCDSTSPEIVAQWHQPNGFKLKSPPISIRIQDCNIMLLTQTSAVYDGKQNTLKKSLISSALQWRKGSWHYFIIDVSFDYAIDGQGGIYVYLNTSDWPTIEDRIIEYQGGVGYHNGIGQNFKLGVYKWRWKFSESVEVARKNQPAVLERVYYYDDVTIKQGLEFEK